MLELPADQVGPGETRIWDTKDFKCNGEATQIRVRVWNDFSKPGQFIDYVTDFRNIRIDRDGMAFAIAVAPKSADIPQPPTAPKLPELGAVDGGSQITVPAAAGDVTGTVAPGGSVEPSPAGSDNGIAPPQDTAVVNGSTVPATSPATSAATGTTVAGSSTSGG